MLVLIGERLRARDDVLIARIGRSRPCIASGSWPVGATMPDHTVRAFADHGEIARTLTADPDAAERTLADAQLQGSIFAIVTAELEREGVQSFCVTHAISCWTASRASSL